MHLCSRRSRGGRKRKKPPGHGQHDHRAADRLDHRSPGAARLPDRCRQPTRDPELRFSAKGTAWCSVGLAVKRTRRLGDGSYEEQPPEFYTLACFGDLAEHVVASLSKHHRVGSPSAGCGTTPGPAGTAPSAPWRSFSPRPGDTTGPLVSEWCTVRPHVRLPGPEALVDRRAALRDGVTRPGVSDQLSDRLDEPLDEPANLVRIARHRVGPVTEGAIRVDRVYPPLRGVSLHLP